MTQQSTTANDVQPRVLGLARWVQVAFLAFGLLLLWLLDKIISIVWDRFAEPQPALVTLTSAVIAAVTTLLLYRNEKVLRISNEIVGELAKVSWPTREEVQASTVVVVITSIIAAIIVGAFDAAWSTITDLIYKV